MAQQPDADTNFNEVRTWLQRAGRNADRCFICKCIWRANKETRDRLEPIRVASVEMTPDAQISHLARCVGARQYSPGDISRIE